MKKLILFLAIICTATAAGLYFRPDYPLIGQLNWFNVLTKGYFVGSFQAFFSQGMLDESFFFVMRFTGGGAVLGMIAAMMGGKSKSSSGKKSKKKAA